MKENMVNLLKYAILFREDFMMITVTLSGLNIG